MPLNKPEPLVERIENLERGMQEVETLLAGKNVLNLTYEDDIEQDPQRLTAVYVNLLIWKQQRHPLTSIKQTHSH